MTSHGKNPDEVSQNKSEAPPGSEESKQGSEREETDKKPKSEQQPNPDSGLTGPPEVKRTQPTKSNEQELPAVSLTEEQAKSKSVKFQPDDTSWHVDLEKLPTQEWAYVAPTNFKLSIIIPFSNNDEKGRSFEVKAETMWKEAVKAYNKKGVSVTEKTLEVGQFREFFRDLYRDPEHWEFNIPEDKRKALARAGMRAARTNPKFLTEYREKDDKRGSMRFTRMGGVWMAAHWKFGNPWKYNKGKPSQGRGQTSSQDSAKQNKGPALTQEQKLDRNQAGAKAGRTPLRPNPYVKKIKLHDTFMETIITSKIPTPILPSGIQRNSTERLKVEKIVSTFFTAIKKVDPQAGLLEFNPPPGKKPKPWGGSQRHPLPKFQNGKRYLDGLHPPNGNDYTNEYMTIRARINHRASEEDLIKGMSAHFNNVRSMAEDTTPIDVAIASIQDVEEVEVGGGA